MKRLTLQEQAVPINFGQAKVLYLIVLIFGLLVPDTAWGQARLPEKSAVSIDFSAIRNNLLQLPTEFSRWKTPGARQDKLNLTIKKKKYELEVWENQLLSTAFKKQNPTIKTYNFKCTNQEHVVGSITMNDQWLTIFLNTPSGFMIIEPIDKSNPKAYGLQSELASLQKYTCDVDEKQPEMDRILQRVYQQTSKNKAVARTTIPNGATLRTYRMAIACTGDFYLNNGNNDAAVNMVITANVNALNSFYKQEMAVQFNLIGTRLYSDPATDPFIPQPQGGCSFADQAGNAISMNFMYAQYDIGHVFNTETDNNGWPFGGQASTGGVCSISTLSGCNRTAQTIGDTPSKARGWSTGRIPNQGVSLQVFFHEVGHQFGANHSWNGTGPGCSLGGIGDFAAWEIGSGTTMMSYNGQCQADNNIGNGRDLYFHTQSLEQMLTHINAFSTCPIAVATNNTPPVVNANSCNLNNFTLPPATPFILSGSGSDADGDNLTYTWEQIDEDGIGSPTQGFIGAIAGASSIAPLFRSYPPSIAASRTFPAIDFVVNNTATTNSFEPLPTVSRTIRFKLTARDNNPNGGGTNGDTLSINVDATLNPFAVTAPNGGETWTIGDNATVTWSNHTAGISNTVSIQLSIDGGFTYPLTLVENTPNDGTWTGMIPTTTPTSTAARIRVISTENTCVQIFDISNADFSILSTSNCGLPISSNICPIDAMTFNAGAADLNLTIINTPINYVNNFTFNITEASATMTELGWDATGTNCTQFPDNTAPFEVVSFTVDRAGAYTFTSNFNNIYHLFSGSTFNPNLGCTGFLASSFQDGLFGRDLRNVPLLNPCTVYHLVSNRSATITIQGPGKIAPILTLPTNTSYTYMAINTANNQIAAESAAANFTTLGAGYYRIYGASYKSGGNTPPDNIIPANLIGQDFTAVQSSQCIIFSNQFKPISIQGNTGIQVNIKAFLEGPYNNGLMNDGLRSGNLIPMTEPYTSLPNFTHVNGGNEMVAANVLTAIGNNAIVDWVFIELRNGTTNTMVEHTRAALLQRDGDIVDTDGSSPITFPMATASNYFVAIRHRNHLGIMTNAAVSLTNTPATVDFTVGGTTVFGTDARADLGNNVWGLFAADVDASGTVDAADRSDTWNARNQNGYLLMDADMSGTTAASDRSITWNNRNRVQQLSN